MPTAGVQFSVQLLTTRRYISGMQDPRDSGPIESLPRATDINAPTGCENSARARVVSVSFSSSDEEEYEDDSSLVEDSHPSQDPDWDKLSINERKALLASYARSKSRERSAYRRARIKDLISKEVYDVTLKPRKLSDVESNPFLQTNDLFATRQLLNLRVAEVCNWLNKIPRWVSLDTDPEGCRAGAYSGFICARSWSRSDTFHVKAVRKEDGWKVVSVDLSRASRRQSTEENTSRKCPFQAKQLAPIIVPYVKDDPSLSARDIKKHLEGYVRDGYITNSIVQATREQAKMLHFGEPKSNIQYIHHLVNAAEQVGHRVKLVSASRDDAQEVLVRIAQTEHKFKMKGLPSEERTAFRSAQWQNENAEYIREVLGDDESLKWITGIYFAPFTSVMAAQNTLKLFSADAAHLSWGPCTLYSMYGRNSEMGAFCIAHAIIAGNEGKRGWKQFFGFVRENYPSLNRPEVTIISDKDKGLLSSLSAVFPRAGGFYCSKHRSDNIAKKFDGKSVSAFNKAVRATTLQELYRIKNDEIRSLPSMRARRYILDVPDSMQFPVSRIALGSTMYGKSTNGMSESMNSANRPSRVRGLDMFHAFAKLIEMEGDRFRQHKESAHNRAHVLTEYAFKKYCELLVKSRNFTVDFYSGHEATIKCKRSNSLFNVVLPEARCGPGSLFGSCSCGTPEFEHFPCEHILTFAQMKEFHQHEIVPLEFQTRTYRSQYDSNLSYADVSVYIARSKPSDPILRLPPDIPRKAGRPRKRRAKSVLERNSKRRRLCSKCRVPGHTAANCTAQLQDT